MYSALRINYIGESSVDFEQILASLCRW